MSYRMKIILAALWLGLAVEGWMLYKQGRIIHDYREYVEAGCHGHYQGED